MDISKINHLSLCSGYGGIDLGLRRALGDRMRTIAYAEIEAFAIECLLARMENGQLDAAPIWPDLRSFPWAEFVGRISILSGGYPCQPFSTAGRRQGFDDPRHIWAFIRNGIAIVQPTMCFFENVEGHISLGLREVVGDLESMGYSVSWGIFSAAETGAPHQRKRVFIMAVSNSLGGAAGLSRSSAWNEGVAGVADHGCNQAWPSLPGEAQHGWEPPRVLVDSKSPRANRGQQFCESECGQGRALPSEPYEPSQSVGNAAEQGCQRSGGANDPRGTIDRPTESNRGCAYWAMEQSQRQAQPALGGDLNGPAGGLGYAELCGSCDNRTDELRLLGNGVVPATAERAFNVLIQKLMQ